MSILATTPSTLVVVDPSPQEYESLRSTAEARGVKVTFFATGQDAICSLQEGPIARWVINARLPDMSGFHLAQALRRVHPKLQIFIVDDTYREDDEIETLVLGLTKYIAKPLEPSQLLPRLRRPSSAQPPSVTRGAGSHPPWIST